MIKEILMNVRNNGPLVHNITNYVTVNDCANILLAVGGAPIMADDMAEVEEITSICGGLNINIGTLNQRTIKSMYLAGLKSNELGHPVLLDPVGAGASKLRTETAKGLIEEIDFTVIRGNISEIKTLAIGQGETRGVDASELDVVTDDNIDSAIAFAKEFSKKTGAIIAITGAIDIIAYEDEAYIIKNGSPKMSKVTGTGCMLSALTTAFVVANKEEKFKAVACATMMMGLAGELAFNKLKADEGNSTYRNYLIDAIEYMTIEQLENGAKYEIR
ncbi:MAG: hydroxyethylthiazole kinase [Anaerovoracaceae bacterium]